jgi:hypothetical protein
LVLCDPGAMPAKPFAARASFEGMARVSALILAQAIQYDTVTDNVPNFFVKPVIVFLYMVYFATLEVAI